MNTRAALGLSLISLVAIRGGACTTSTPIGVVDNHIAGTSGSAPAGTAGTSGSNPSGTAGASGTAALPQGPYVPSPDQTLNDPPFTNPSGVASDWAGYLENYQLRSGSDAIKLHFGVGAQGQTTLTVVLGAGPPPPPPVDPLRLWPEDPNQGYFQSSPLVEGFAYTAHHVTWDGLRLRFQLLTNEPWTAWCNIQTSYQHGDQFNCNVGAAPRDITGAGGTAGPCAYADAPSSPCSWGHVKLCADYGVCVCNATGCGANVQGNFEPYDIAFYGDHADGSALAHNIRLRPATP